MSEPTNSDRRLYKARGPDGEVAWVDHDELWRLQQRQAQELRRERVRRRRLLLLGLAALVVAMLALAFLRLRQGTAPSETAGGVVVPETAAAVAPPEAAVAESAGVEETSPAAPGPRAAADVEPPSGAPAPPPEQPTASTAQEPAPPTELVAAAVRGWADAWGRRDVESYLASYSASFQPGDGASRSAWRGLRRRRLERPAWIRVEIEDLEIAWRDGGRAEARFRQSYESPLYADVVRKSLELVEEEGDWRIIAERAVPLAAG